MKRIVSIALLASVAFSACSGGGSKTVPVVAPASTGQQTASVAFSIALPPKSLKYISANTKSVAVVVTPTGAAALPASLINCSSTACSGSVLAPVGNDTFAVTLYDRANGTGNALSSGSTSATIVANRANTVNMTFIGIPASIQLSMATYNATLGTPSNAIPLTVAVKDASGATIIGAYPVTVTLTSGDTHVLLSRTSVNASTDAVTVTYDGSTAVATTVAIDASAAGIASSKIIGTSLGIVGGGSDGPQPAEFMTQASATKATGNVFGGARGAIIGAFSGADDLRALSSVAFTPDSLTIGRGTAASSAARAPQSAFANLGHPFVAPMNKTLPDFHPAPLQVPAGAIRHASGATRSIRSSTIPSSAVVGSTANIWVQNGSLGGGTGSYQQIASTLESQTAHGNIWVDSSLLTGSNSVPEFSANLATTMSRIATVFENDYTSDTTHFASPNYDATAPGTGNGHLCDSTGAASGIGQAVVIPSDQKINVVILNTQALGSGVGGYFSGLDYYTQGFVNCFDHTRKSNEAPVIYVGYYAANGSQFELNEDLVRGIAHEFQHLINFANHVIINPAIVNGQTTPEERFIDEGLSVLAQDLAVPALYPGIAHDVDDALQWHGAVYLENPGNFSISGFSGIDPPNFNEGTSPKYNCGGGCYGSAFLFQLYLRDRCGGDIYTHGMETLGTVGVANILNACGPHTAGEGLGSLVADFGMALGNNALRAGSPVTAFGLTSLNVDGHYTDQFGGSFVMPGLFTQPVALDGSLTASAPIGGLTFFSLSGIPLTGENVSLTDNATAAGFALAGGIVAQ